MKHYITFEKAELSSTITNLGYNLHQVAESIIYFKQYAKLKGVEHDAVADRAIEDINETLLKLRKEFNLPFEDNICLENISQNRIDAVVSRCNINHYNPHSKS